MKKKMNLILRKCKSLSRQLARSSSYSSLRSKSTREDIWGSENDGDIQKEEEEEDDEKCETIFVGSTRKRYVVSSKYLNHPLLNALMEKSKQKVEGGGGGGHHNNGCALVVNCEVVLFDHLLWMLEHADPKFASSESLDELADLYVF